MKSGSDRVMKLHEKVEKLRESEEIGVRFYERMGREAP